MSASTLSVLMCVYNHAAYVGEALEAILAQSYRPLEIIVIDDGSTDGGAEVIARYAARDERIRFFSNDVNKGFLFSVQRGLALVRGDYVFGAAADDKVLPGLFEKSMMLLERYPDAGLCSARSKVIGPAGQDLGELWVPTIVTASAYLPPDRALEILDRQCSWFLGNTAVYRRQALHDAGGFIPDLGSFCDGFICMVLAAKHGACFIPETLAAWRRTDQNFSSQTGSDPRLVLDIMDRAGTLMLTAYRDLFSPPFVRRWQRRWFADFLDGLTGRQRESVRLCAARVPSPTARDRVYFWFLRAALCGITLVTKLYTVSRANFPVQVRIVRGKFRVGGGPGRAARR